MSRIDLSGSRSAHLGAQRMPAGQPAARHAALPCDPAGRRRCAHAGDRSACQPVGGRGRDRTYDQSIKSRMLYQLSYASLLFCSGEEIGESLEISFGPRLRSRDFLKIPQPPGSEGTAEAADQPTKSTSAFTGMMPRSKPISSSLWIACLPSSP